MTVETSLNASESAPTTEISTAPAVAPAATASPDATKVDPSATKDVSLLDSVKAALKPKTEASSASPESQDPSAKPEGAAEGDEEPEGDPTEEELARYHSKTRKRMSKLMGERNAALDEVKTLTPDAEIGRRITSYIADSGMSSDEANLLLEVGRNMKRDPLKALEQLKPYYDALTRMSGDVLPDDLRQEVEAGRLTDGHAKELARSRTERQVLTHRSQASETHLRERTQQQNIEAHAAAVSGAVSTWEANQAKSDPDWKLKQGRIGELIELEVRRSGFPKTTQDAVAMAEKAKVKVTQELAQFAPRRPAITNVNPASAARAPIAKPSSAIEAARLALKSA